METGENPTLITISLCLIVKNEEQTIGRCLSSVQSLVDEIIIVDTGSTDKTKEIVTKFTDKIYDFEWINDFAAARNYAFSQAKSEYILWLDADDVILPADREALSNIKNTVSPDIDVISMPYNLSFNEQGKAATQIRRNRIVKRQNNFQWIGAVHEYLEVWGNRLSIDAAVTHLPLSHDAGRNLYIYEQRLLKGEQFSPRDLYYFANELKDHQLYYRAIEYYQKFLDTKQGWIEDNIGACGKLADCFYNFNDIENQLKYIYLSFKYAAPRADFCCRLGYYHLSSNEMEQAVFWYKVATELETPSESWGLLNIQCQTWLPHIQLCVCYSRMGQYQLAYEHNEIAATYIPSDARIELNRNYLKNMMNI